MPIINHRVALLFAVLFTLARFSGLAQDNTDIQLASQYYQNGEFDKAALYYEKLYNQNPNDIYYNYLFNCYLKLEDFKKIKKINKDQQNLFPLSQKYKIDEGRIYMAEDDDKKAEKHFENLISKESQNHSKVIQLAKAFSDIGLHKYALQTYMQARKSQKSNYPYNFEIANVYGDLGNYEGMISEYLELLLINENYLRTIQNVLNRNFGFDPDSKQNKILKTELIRYIQKYPQRDIYGEMLIWLFVQENNFEAAIRQAKAINTRNAGNGDEIMELVLLSSQNKAFDAAIGGLDYIISLGKSNLNYISAKIKLLEVLNTKITSEISHTNEDILKLDSNFQSTLLELGQNYQTAGLMKQRSELLAFYLNQTAEAIALLDKTIELPRITDELIAECKLLKGDILLAAGDIWEASLLYSQVDKSFKYDYLGEKAKLKNAKIWYYTGNFNLAKSQLDILKGSTSKLTANDALELSLLITDNTGLDSTETALKIYASADLLITQKKYKRAIELLDSLKTSFPLHPLTDEIYFLKYRYYKQNKDFDTARDYLIKIVDEYPEDIIADKAHFLLGELYQFQFNDAENAMEFYQKVIIDYPNSLYLIEARKRFRELRGDAFN